MIDAQATTTEAGAVCFMVRGIPIPKGSTKAFMRPGMRFPIVTADNPKTRPWANDVKLMAQQYAPAAGPWPGPVRLDLQFFMPKPKSLPKTRPSWPVKKPDLDKLTRTIKDALKGVFYLDDAQVTDMHLRKRYHDAPGVQILIMPATDL